MVLIDLSHPIEPGMPCYPGLAPPRWTPLFTHDESAGRYAPGTEFCIVSIEVGNTGTYVDAPFHRHRDGADLAGVPLARLADLDAVVVDADGAIGAEAFAGLTVAGKAVLVRTGWASRWGDPSYFTSGPFLTAAACHALVDAGVLLVGIDCANIDDMADRTRPAHTILLGAGVPIVEHLRGLEALPGAGARFFAVPPAVRGGTSFPVRAFAIYDE